MIALARRSGDRTGITATYRCEGTGTREPDINNNNNNNSAAQSTRVVADVHGKCSRHRDRQPRPSPRRLARKRGARLHLGWMGAGLDWAQHGMGWDGMWRLISPHARRMQSRSGNNQHHRHGTPSGVPLCVSASMGTGLGLLPQERTRRQAASALPVLLFILPSARPAQKWTPMGALGDGRASEPESSSGRRIATAAGWWSVCFFSFGHFLAVRGCYSHQSWPRRLGEERGRVRVW